MVSDGKLRAFAVNKGAQLPRNLMQLGDRALSQRWCCLRPVALGCIYFGPPGEQFFQPGFGILVSLAKLLQARYILGQTGLF